MYRLIIKKKMILFNKFNKFERLKNFLCCIEMYLYIFGIILVGKLCFYFVFFFWYKIRRLVR